MGDTIAPAQRHTLAFKWQGKEFTIDVGNDDTIGTLKRRIEEHTDVQPKRQKLLGLKAKGSSGAPADDVPVSQLQLKPGQKIMLMGTPAAETANLDKMAEVAPHVQDDFDLQDGVLQDLELHEREENQEKLRRRIASVDVKVLAPPRPGKKCVVLDIDYTIFDLGSSAERPEELARPHLHEFMAAVYAFYDIIIWSATSMKWVEVKMRELGVTTHTDYKVTALLDHKAMITVQTERYGVFDCKPLGFLWAKFEGIYTPENTIMLDDLRRNYVMNKQNGLVIRPFRKAHQTRATDRELLHLKIYLLKVAELDSLSQLNHRRWESYIKDELHALK